jgi:hypothetical protein
MKKRKIAILVLATLVMGCIALWVITAMQPERLSKTEAAKRALTAWFEGDSDSLYSLIADVEKEEMDLDKEKFRVVMNTVIKPRMQQLERVGDPTVTQQRGSAFLSIAQEARTKSGLPITIGVEAYDSPAGGKVAFGTILYVTYMADHLLRTGKPVKPNERHKAFARGLEHDKDILQRAGLTHWYSIPGGSSKPFDEIRQKWLRA